MKPNQKITHEQRQQLLDLYIKGGFAAVAPLASRLGVTAKYIADFASRQGKRREATNRCTQTENDKRWAWARERGSVVA